MSQASTSAVYHDANLQTRKEVENGSCILERFSLGSL